MTTWCLNQETGCPPFWCTCYSNKLWSCREKINFNDRNFSLFGLLKLQIWFTSWCPICILLGAGTSWNLFLFTSLCWLSHQVLTKVKVLTNFTIVHLPLGIGMVSLWQLKNKKIFCKSNEKSINKISATFWQRIPNWTSERHVTVSQTSLQPPSPPSVKSNSGLAVRAWMGGSFFHFIRVLLPQVGGKESTEPTSSLPDPVPLPSCQSCPLSEVGQLALCIHWNSFAIS